MALWVNYQPFFFSWKPLQDLIFKIFSKFGKINWFCFYCKWHINLQSYFTSFFNGITRLKMDERLNGEKYIIRAYLKNWSLKNKFNMIIWIYFFLLLNRKIAWIFKFKKYQFFHTYFLLSSLIIKYLMKKSSTPSQPPKAAKPVAQTKAFNADDYVTVTLPRE